MMHFCSIWYVRGKKKDDDYKGWEYGERKEEGKGVKG